MIGEVPVIMLQLISALFVFLSHMYNYLIFIVF